MNDEDSKRLLDLLERLTIATEGLHKGLFPPLQAGMTGAGFERLPKAVERLEEGLERLAERLAPRKQTKPRYPRAEAAEELGISVKTLIRRCEQLRPKVNHEKPIEAGDMDRLLDLQQKPAVPHGFKKDSKKVSKKRLT